MSRPLMTQDYLLIGAVAFVILACLLALARAFPETWIYKRKGLTTRKNLRKVHGPQRRTHTGERSLDLHQTTGIDGHNRVGARAQN